MGVMACARRDCEEILCHTLIDGHYICGTCLAQLIYEKDKNWPAKMNEEEVKEAIDDFLDSSAGEEDPTEEALEDIQTRDRIFQSLVRLAELFVVAWVQPPQKEIDPCHFIDAPLVSVLVVPGKFPAPANGFVLPVASKASAASSGSPTEASPSSVAWATA